MDNDDVDAMFPSNNHLNLPFHGSGSNGGGAKPSSQANSMHFAAPSGNNARRVSMQFGGPGGGGPMDRRRSSVGTGAASVSATSLPFDINAEINFMGRRGSMNFTDEHVQPLHFGRRDSLDSTTAVLDACILDLTRRRLSMAMGGAAASGAASGTGPNQNDAFAQPQGNQSAAFSNTSSLMAQSQTIAARQQQIQQQQLELDQRKKELELHRQQLHSEAHFGPSVFGHNSSLNVNAGGAGGGMNRGMGPSGGMNQQWWICQICNTRAFASRDEAMQHEAICGGGTGTGGGGGHPKMDQVRLHQPHQPPQQQSVLFPPLGPPIAGPDGSESHSGSSADNDSPFAVLPQTLPLAMDSDKDWLTPLHCFVRRHCVQVFCATAQDVATPSKGKRKPIQVGQVGIRCPHCHNSANAHRERGSVYYPTTISSIYNATMNLLQRHLHSCSAVPEEIMQRYQTLKADDARSGTSKKYWVESALSLGLVDTPHGIRYSSRRPPPLPRLSRQQQGLCRRNSNDFFSTSSNAIDNKPLPPSSVEAPSLEANKTPAIPLVTPEDKPYATAFSYHLLSQMQPCEFTEADRLGKRKGLPAGFAGLACRHCFGGYGSGRFFPSSIKTLSDTSKTLNVLHNHMMRCRKCPQEVRDTLEKLRAHHDDERAKMKFGSQKAFFAKIWARLHETQDSAGVKRKESMAFGPSDLTPMTNISAPNLHPHHLMQAPPPMVQPPPYSPTIAAKLMAASKPLGLDILSSAPQQPPDTQAMKRQRLG